MRQLKEPYKTRIETWVKALRVGGYEQGRYAMYNHGNETFCCLGVACDLLVDNQSDWSMSEGIDGWSSFVMPEEFGNHDPDDSYIHPYIVDYYGFKNGDAGFDGKVVYIKDQAFYDEPVGSMTALNDHCECNFLEIADFIEEYPESIFREECFV